jgi:MFS family permease
MLLVRRTGLWTHADFLRLWSGQTISVFGSMIGGTALSFTAILFLHATPVQLGVLGAMQIAPALLAGLFAGAWVDRLRRRPLLIAADMGRAVVFATIPLAALLGVLRIQHVYAVALAAGVLTILFDVAYQSYLPALLGTHDLLEGNSKLTGSAAAAESAAFGVAGWLVQTLTAPVAILIDAASFVVSAVTLGLIRTREPAVVFQKRPNMYREIGDGLRAVWRNRLLRALALAELLHNLAGGIWAALVVLYMSRGLGFSPGILGMIWAVGGVSSFLGAALAPRVTRRLGGRRTLVIGLGAFGASQLLVPLATGAGALSAVLLLLQQVGDGFYTIYAVNEVSLRQRVVPERLLGRVSATMRSVGLAAVLAGSLTGGILGQALNVRLMLAVAACCTLLAAGTLARSPRETPPARG